MRSVVRASKIERPSQVLGSILLFDKCVDRALDKEALSSVEQGLLDGIRERLATATVVWDRRSDRRDFERADCDLDIHIRLVSRDSMDEELKSSYQEGDAKFNEAFEELLAEVPSGAAHVQNLCAGGVSLLLSHEDAAGAKVGDYVSLESGDTPVPFNLDSLSARVTGTQELKDEGKINLNLSFLPYERELRRQIIGVVYEAAEAAPKKSEPDIAQGTEKQDAKAAAKTPAQTMPTQKGVARKSAAKKKSRKTPAEEAKKGKTSVRPRRKKRRRPDAASKTDRNE